MCLLYFLGTELDSLSIGVGDSFDQASFIPSSYTDCASNLQSWSLGERRYVACSDEIKGRYVSVYLTATAVLSLCGVSVFTVHRKYITHFKTFPYFCTLLCT